MQINKTYIETFKVITQIGSELQNLAEKYPQSNAIPSEFDLNLRIGVVKLKENDLYQLFREKITATKIRMIRDNSRYFVRIADLRLELNWMCLSKF